MTGERDQFQNARAAPSEAGRLAPFASGHARAVWAIVFLAVVGAADAASAGCTYSVYRALVAGMRVTSEPVGGLIGWTDNLAMIGAIIAFSMWTHRVYRNLPALGARDLRYTPGWAVGYLFVPFINLVVPYFVFAEIWRNSIPAPADSDDRRGKRVSPLLIGWWIVNILPFVVLIVLFVAAVVEVYSGVMTSTADPAGALLVQLSIVLQLLGSAAATLAIFVVRRIDKNQRARYAMIRETAGIALNPDRGSVS